MFLNGINTMDSEILLSNIEKIHTTPMGVERIKKNLNLQTDDVVEYCKKIVASPKSKIERTGKNWYIFADASVITINAYSYTIITAHKKK